jgi:hypothetical protein
LRAQAKETIKNRRENMNKYVLCLAVCLAFILALPVQARPQTRSTHIVGKNVSSLKIYRYSEVVTINASDPADDTYSGSANCPWVIPNCDLDVAIDLDTNVWTFMWSGSDVIVAPSPAALMGCWWAVSDDAGYSNGSTGNVAASGTVYLSHTDANVWTQTTVHWTYNGGIIFYCVALTVNIYTGQDTAPSGTGGYGGGGGAASVGGSACRIYMA